MENTKYPAQNLIPNIKEKNDFENTHVSDWLLLANYFAE